MKKFVLIIFLLQIMSIYSMNQDPARRRTISMEELDAIKNTTLCCCFIVKICGDMSLTRFIPSRSEIRDGSHQVVSSHASRDCMSNCFVCCQSNVLLGTSIQDHKK